MKDQPTPESRGAATLTIFLFGALALTYDARPLRLATRKSQLLLAYLVLFPGPHTRDHLATLLWGDMPEDQARHSLRTALHTLRSAIGGELLHTERATVQLNPHFPLWVDVWELCRAAQSPARRGEELRGALELYRDDLLADCYDDWVLLERERYRALYLRGLLDLAQQLRSQSKYQEASSYARRVLDRDPLNEQAHQHLIFCLVALGQRSEGLQHYELLKRTLGEELGAEPAPETVSLARWARRSHPAEQTAARVSNLPVPLSSFVGRQQALAQLADLLGKTRLLTLVGVGGSGKTRLAIQLGAGVLERFPDGVWWVELGALRDAGLVPQVVADALGLREQPGESPAHGLARMLQAKRLLLVLDNCEHLVPACTRLLGALLGRCPQLRVLATSRSALRLPGERVYQVPPLSLPPASGVVSADAAAGYEAVQLFVERAQAAEAGFGLTPATAAAVVQICRRLDGLPFALELAAAQLGTLTLLQMAARLEERLSLPFPHPSPGLLHQHTLRAMIDWSYGLLTAEERLLLGRLAVFAGWFAVESVEQVCGPLATPALELLGRLAHKALALVEYDAEGPRYRLLATVQQYAEERLAASGEEGRLRAAHLAYYTRLVEIAEPHVYNAGQAVWFERLEAAHDNIRAALRWALDTRQALAALRLGAVMGEFWEVRGHWAEGRRWLDEILANGPVAAEEAPATAAARWRATATWQASALAWRQCDFARARALLQQCIAGYRAIGDLSGLAKALLSLAALIYEQGDYASAGALWAEGLLLCRRTGDVELIASGMFGVALAAFQQGDLATARVLLTESLALERAVGYHLGVTYPLNTLGNLENLEGNYAAAERCYAECLAMRRELDYRRGVAATLSDLGNVRLKQGDVAAAAGHYRESLAIFQELGNGRGVACALSGLARIAQRQGLLLAAARLHGGAAAELGRLGASLDEPERSDRERALAALRTQLPPEQLPAAWAAGAALSAEELSLLVSGI